MGDLVQAKLDYITFQVKKNLGSAAESMIKAGEWLLKAKTDFFAEAEQGFVAYCDEKVGVPYSTAKKLIKVFETFGDCEDAHEVGFSVLKTLTYSPDPKERLREALELKKEQGKVTVQDAKNIAQKAREIVERGEKQEFIYMTPAEQKQAVAELQEAIEEVSDSGQTEEKASLRTTKVEQAKRALRTLHGLLNVELTNAELSERDLKDAVLEMLLSSDEVDAVIIDDLRGFCRLIADTSI